MSRFRPDPGHMNKNIFLQKSEESTRRTTKNLSFSQRRRPRSKEEIKARLIWTAQICSVIFLAFFLVFSFGRTIRISGSSMEPTLRAGDRVLVNRLVYHIRKPRAGDLVVFHPSGRQNAQYMVKRLIARPGDTVYISGGRLYVNNSAFRQGTVSFSGIGYAGNLAEKTQLGDDQYLVMGDNFNNSEDSRYASIGLLSRRDFVGKIWFDVSLSHFGPAS